MGLEKPKNGAWQDVESVNKPVNGAWQECEVVNKPKNGAWEEIWSAVKYMIELNNTITNGYLDIKDEDLTFSFFKYEDVYDGKIHGSVSGSGTITFYIEGNWVNPTISFDWEGGFIRSNAQVDTWYRASAGSISVYAREKGSVETITKTAVSRVGSTESSSDYLENEIGSYSGSLEGTYDRLGLEIYITGYNSASGFFSASLDMIVKNLLFSGTKIAFPVSSEFDIEDF